MIDILIQNYNNTHAIIIDEVIVAFTTVYEEVENLILEICDELDIDTWDINVQEN